MNLNALKPETFSTDKLDYFFKPDEVEEGDLFRELQQEYTDMRRVDYCVDEECKLLFLNNVVCYYQLQRNY